MKRPSSYFSRTLFNLLLQQSYRSKQEGGYIIVVVAGMIVAMIALLLTAEQITRVDANSTKSSGNSAAGFYAAEAGLNLRATEIRAKFEGYNVPTGISPIVNNSANPACQGSNLGSGDFACNNSLTVQDYLYPNDSTKRIPVSTYVVDQNLVNGVSTPTSVTIGPNEPFAGLNAQEYRFDVASTAYDNTNNRNPTAFLGIRFKSRLVPLFQFFAFYQNDLDITRPATMTINGPIHTNGSLYLNVAQDVTINGQLSSAGRMYRGEKDPNEKCNHNSNGYSGKLRILNPGNNQLQEMPCYGSPNGEITTGAPTNSNRISVGGTYINDWAGQIFPRVAALTPPPSSLVDAKLPDPANNQTYDYWNKADLRIALRLSNDTAEAPVSIEVVNADQSTNATATAVLNGDQCVPQPAGPAPMSGPVLIKTTLAANGTANSPAITVADAGQFNVGDAIKIFRNSDNINDFDENVILSKSGNQLTLARPLGKQSINTSGGTVTVQKAIVWSSKTFFNYREKTLDLSTTVLAEQGRLIRMLNVDVQGIMNCGSALMGKSLDDPTEGGLVWHFTVLGPRSNADTTKTTPDSPNSYGVRLYNGATLGSSAGTPAIKGLTVVSDQAMYVRGDYNSNNKKPASLLADSINILSNNSPLSDNNNTITPLNSSCTGYDAIYNATDCNVIVALDKRLASSTTVNAAFLAGVDVTGTAPGENGGGLNNYPRLHEQWSGTTLTYKGSMVSLGKARRVNGKFGTSGTDWNIYLPPSRAWSYDTDFNNAANLPPLSPRFVYLRQERFSRDFTRTSFLPRSSPFASIFPTQFVSLLPPVTNLRFNF